MKEITNWNEAAKDADAVEIAAAIGMKIYPKGRNNFILCPGHEKRLGKPDINPTNAIITHDGYYCFGCGCFVRTPEMIMEFLGCDKKEAFRIIMDSLGGEDLYLNSYENEKRFTLSGEEIKALGLTALTDSSLSVFECFQKAPEIMKKAVMEQLRKVRLIYREMINRYNTKEGAYELYEFANVNAEKRNDLLEVLRDRLKILDDLEKRIGEKR